MKVATPETAFRTRVPVNSAADASRETEGVPVVTRLPLASLMRTTTSVMVWLFTAFGETSSSRVVATPWATSTDWVTELTPVELKVKTYEPVVPTRLRSLKVALAEDTDLVSVPETTPLPELATTVTSPTKLSTGLPEESLTSITESAAKA